METWRSRKGQKGSTKNGEGTIIYRNLQQRGEGEEEGNCFGGNCAIKEFPQRRNRITPGGACYTEVGQVELASPGIRSEGRTEMEDSMRG